MEEIKGMENKEGERLAKLKEAIGDYCEKEIPEISGRILETFEAGKLERIHDPSGYTHPGVVYRNFIYGLIWDAPEANDELNYTLYGIALKKAMDKNPEFDKYVREYIKKAQQADSEAWNQKEAYRKKSGMDEHVLVDDQNADVYTQGKIMAKFILGEI